MLGEELFTKTQNAAVWSAMYQPEIYRDRPDDFSHMVLDSETWSKQSEILNSLCRYGQTWVKACHGSGKSYAAALALLYWLGIWDDGVVISTAPKQDQVERILWGEVHAAIRRSKYPWPQPNVASLRFNEKRYATGTTTTVTAQKGSTAFQGTHSGHVLIIVDEAPGIHPALWGAIEGIRAAGYVRVLALGNPTIPSGPFYDAFTTRSPNINCITISAFDTPNFKDVYLKYIDTQTGKIVIFGNLNGRNLLEMDVDELNDNPAPYLTTKSWVRELYDKVGPDHYSFISRALGQFPHEAPDSLISLRWLELAAEREFFAEDNDKPIKGGIDVAGPGEDETTLFLRQGRNVLLQKAYPEADPTGRVLADLMPFRDRIENLNIDADGIGYYFAKTIESNGYKVTFCHAGWAAIDTDQFFNWKAEMYWGFRMRCQAGDIAGLKDSVTSGQLTTIRWNNNPRGQTVIESKEDARKRGVKSPDRAEGAMLAFAEAPVHGILELWRDEYEAQKRKAPEPRGPKVEDTTAIPFKEQAAAAKEESEVPWTKAPESAPKLPARPVCDQCGSTGVRVFSEAWQCAVCGASGKI